MQSMFCAVLRLLRSANKRYTRYWAGSLEIHSLDGYGVDAFLQISKLGNKNEQLSTRASMDAV